MGAPEVVYAHTVEGLFWRSLKGRVSPALKGQLKAKGLDLDGAPRDVPREAWVEMLRAAVEDLYPRLPPDQGYFELGRSLVRGYNETISGKAMLSILRLLGPARGLKRLSTNLKAGNSYSELRVAEQGPSKFEGWLNECNGNPHYIRGIIVEGLTFAGAKNVQVEARGFDGHACTYAMSWG